MTGPAQPFHTIARLSCCFRRDFSQPAIDARSSARSFVPSLYEVEILVRLSFEYLFTFYVGPFCVCLQCLNLYYTSGTSITGSCSVIHTRERLILSLRAP